MADPHDPANIYNNPRTCTVPDNFRYPSRALYMYLRYSSGFPRLNFIETRTPVRGKTELATYATYTSRSL